jgi:hypothetical protein
MGAWVAPLKKMRVAKSGLSYSYFLFFLRFDFKKF